MKLLIITQKVHKDDPILGFFHRWIEEFAKHTEQLTVICLEEGTHTLPDNARVLSLGKESGTNKLTQLLRLYIYVWKYRHEYDNVFVHMNQIYVVLCGWLWRLLQKKIGLWYAHGAVSYSLRFATWCTHFIFTSTPEGFRVNTKKRQIMGQGIDTQHFSPAASRAGRNSDVLQLITVGRIASSKNIETLLAACSLLKTKQIPFHFTIVGNANTESEVLYEQYMHTYVQEHGLHEHVTWYGPVTQAALPEILHTADVFIHDGATQSLDKTPLEAATSGLVVVSSNRAYVSFATDKTPQYLFAQKNSAALAAILLEITQQTSEERIRAMYPVIEAIQENHSVKQLISGIVSRY
jgi:glycosyltransferase involved in cell wall biosynthesis